MILKDMTVLKPVPRGTILYGDPPVEYPIMSIVDLKYEQMIDLMETAATNGENLPTSIPELMVRMRRQIKSVAPTLPDAVLEDMTYRQLIDFLNAAMGASENPQQAAAGAESASSTN